MTTLMLERPEDAAGIEALIDTTFGSDRHRKTVYRLREDVAPLAGLSFVAVDGGRVAGSLRFWPVLIGGEVEAILLGPLSVDPARQGSGIGSALMWHGLGEAQRLGHRIVLLVGDYDYYVRFGFRREVTEHLELPGWVDRNRFLGRALVPGAADHLAGMVERWIPPEARLRAVA